MVRKNQRKVGEKKGDNQPYLEISWKHVEQEEPSGRDRGKRTLEDLCEDFEDFKSVFNASTHAGNANTSVLKRRMNRLEAMMEKVLEKLNGTK